MTAIGWLQAIVFFLIILALTKPLGSVYGTRIRGRAHVAESRARARRKAHLPPRRRA